MSTAATRSPEEHARLLDLHNSFKPVWLTETIQLGPWLPSDRDIIAEYMNDPRVYEYLFGPPIPYTLKDADDWLAMRVERMTEKGTPLDFAFRDMARGGRDHSDESLAKDDTEYWLAPEYHGQSLMAKALKMMLYRVSVIECGKRKFNSFAFEGNRASRRTLKKVGFVVQKDMTHSIVKYGKMIPQWGLRLYLTEEDVERWEKETLEATPLPCAVRSFHVE